MRVFSNNLTKVTNFILNFKRELALAFLISSALIAAGPLLNRIGTESVLVANQDLSAGSVLNFNDFKIISIPAKYKAANALNENEIQNLHLVSNIQKGEQLTSTRFLTFVQTDKKLVPIRIADSQISKIIQPGQIVDIVASSERDVQAKLLAKSVRIIALYPENQAFTNSQGILVLVEAEPEAAVTLAGSGNLKLSLVISNK